MAVVGMVLVLAGIAWLISQWNKGNKKVAIVIWIIIAIWFIFSIWWDKARVNYQ